MGWKAQSVEIFDLMLLSSYRTMVGWKGRQLVYLHDLLNWFLSDHDGMESSSSSSASSGSGSVFIGSWWDGRQAHAEVLKDRAHVLIGP